MPIAPEICFSSRGAGLESYGRRGIKVHGCVADDGEDLTSLNEGLGSIRFAHHLI
jgi:hypothetical protein